MIFNSIFFLFVFLPITLILYYVVPWRLKNVVLLCVSLVFYAWGEPVYIFLMLFSILFNYFGGIWIERYREQENNSKQKQIFWITVAMNLVILGFFKYFGFLLNSINAVLPIDISYKELALPVGISIYTLQVLSYIIDIYKGKVSVQKNFIAFGTYVTMFPQLIAGPIVRYADIEEQLTKRRITIDKFGQGLAWFIRGLGKMVLLANNIGMVYNTIAALEVSQRSVLTAWIGCLAFAMQIYFYFSGYSDMAIGLGKMLGFEFMKNFDYPYISKSVTEFWRRWYISLGSWFRKYVYSPLGGNRVSLLVHIRNILVVWILIGFWHGAAWNFMAWGLYYAVWLLIEKYLLGGLLERLPGAAAQVWTFIVVMFGWILFFSPGLKAALAYMGNMIGIGGAGFIDGSAIYYLKSSLITFIICCFCCRPIVWKKFQRFVLGKEIYRAVVAVVVYGIIFLLCIPYLVNATYNPFLYFRF